MSKEKVGIIGCGWLGYRLAQYLKPGFEIHATVTSESKLALLRKEGFHPEIVNFEKMDDDNDRKPWQKLTLMDHIIVTVPLFSKRIDQNVLDTRVKNLSSFIRPFKGTLISMSSIGVYKDFSGMVTEEMLPVENCKGEQEIRQLFEQANILRLGGLMGDDRLLSKYKITEIDATVNHVHFYDICRIVQLLLENKASAAVYNVVAPLHPSKRSIIKAQTGATPETLTTTASGKTVLSQKIVKELNYQFAYPDPRLFHL